MDINNMQLVTNAYQNTKILANNKALSTVTTTSSTNNADSASTVKDDVAVIYEKSSVVDQMKYDSQIRSEQLKNYVTQTLYTQAGFSSDNDEDVWKFLADGNYTVSQEVSDKAKEAISEDGYWGVEQTSERILSFAKAISGNDSTMANKLLSAFKEGFKAATASWGKDLPDISSKTLAAVEEKFQAWIDSPTEDQTITSANQVSPAVDASL